VFAGPSVSGIDDLRAAVADFGSSAEADEAPPLEPTPVASPPETAGAETGSPFTENGTPPSQDETPASEGDQPAAEEVSEQREE
jgi:hypothetical protein